MKPKRHWTLPHVSRPLAALRKRGVGLIEASLFVVISLGLIAGGIVFFQQTSEAARVNEAVQSIVSIQSGVRSLYATEKSFGAEGSDLAEAAVASGSVTKNMVRSDGSIVNQWGGDVSITGNSKTFVVDYREVPQAACVRLAPHSIAGNGAAGTGIAAVAINGVLVDEDGDGSVSPTEAEAACGLSLASGQPMQMKWAFMADTRMHTSAWEVEEDLGIDPEETGRENEVESRACGVGFLGNESRNRDHVTLSNGTVVPTDWTEWDRSSCVEIVESSRRTETENGACPTGMVGQTSRTRDVIVMSDGEERIGAWSDWNTSACEIVEVSRRTESENGSCPTGLVGTATRTREVAVMSDGSEQPQAWSSWNNSQCLVVEVSRRTETENGACPAGLLGTANRTRTVLVMSNGTEQPQAWSSWNNAGCSVGEVSRRTDTETAACGTGFTGNQTRTQVVIVMSNGTEQPQGWSGWNRSGCAVQNVIVQSRTYWSETLETCTATASAPILTDSELWGGEVSLAGGGGGGFANGRMVRRYAETRHLWTNGTVTRDGWRVAAIEALPGQPEVDLASANMSSSDLWGGSVIKTGGGGGQLNPPVGPNQCYGVYGTYVLDVREFADCATFGQQSYTLRRYTIANNGATSSAVTGSGGCGYY